MQKRLTDETDEHLIELAQQGHTAAYGVLYDRYLTPIYNYIFYRVGHVHEAEDLAETVFFKAWQALDQYQITAVPFLAWLYRIARNVLTDSHRRQALSERTLPQISYESPLVDDASLDQRLIHEQDVKQLLAAVRELEQIQQDVILLRFVQGLDHEETAQIVNRTVGAVRVIQHRALKALREKFNK